MGNAHKKLELNLDNINSQNSEQVGNDSGRSETFTCEICIEPMSSSAKKFKSNASCTHPFCTDCLAKYIQAKLDDSVAIIKCPALHCDQLLDPFCCRTIISAELFIKWCDCLCDSSLLLFEKCYCPYQDCSALIINECGGSVKKSKCPNCKRLFCYTCEAPWHAGYWCTESRQIRDANDVMFGELVEKFKWTRCPHCGQAVERRDGCQTVLCRCGTSFCHKCGKKCHYGPCALPQSHAQPQSYGSCFHLCCILLFVLMLELLLFVFHKI